jgi:hypothetical protein
VCNTQHMAAAIDAQWLLKLMGFLPLLLLLL